MHASAVAIFAYYESPSLRGFLFFYYYFFFETLFWPYANISSIFPGQNSSIHRRADSLFYLELTSFRIYLKTNKIYVWVLQMEKVHPLPRLSPFPSINRLLPRYRYFQNPLFCYQKYFMELLLFTNSFF